MPKKTLVKIDPDRSGDGVILNSPSPACKTKVMQPPLRLNHFFTYNNYRVEEIDLIVTTLKRFAYKGKIQSEVCPTTGTPHLQGMIWCREKHRDTEFKLPKQIHWESLKDTNNTADYCAKDESHDGIFRTSWGFPKPLKLITPDKPWQLKILEILSHEPDDRLVYWFWSTAGGVGKSSFAKYLVVRENCLFFEEGKKADIMHLIFEAPEERLEKMIIDVPRANGNNISYKSIESIKNGLIYSSKYEGGYKYFNSPHVIVFANAPPKWTELSTDRWRVYNIDTENPEPTYPEISAWPELQASF